MPGSSSSPFRRIPETPKPLDDEHDFRLAMHGNAITVTPLMLQHTHYPMVDQLDGALAL
jgi:5'-nucleotidase